MSEGPARVDGEDAGAAEPYHPLPATPVADKPDKKSNELALRLLSSAVLIPLVIYVIAAGGIPYLLVVMGFTALGQREFYGLIEEKGAHPLVGLGLATGAALCVVAYVGSDYHVTLLLTLSLLGFMIAQLGKAQITEALASISGTFFGVFYVGWLLSHAVSLRFFFDAALVRYRPEELLSFGLHPDSGIFFMIFTLAVVVWVDAGAYFAGRAFGRHKLAPRISPGKTVEGALGGLLGGVALGLLAKGVFDLFWPELSAAFAWRLVIPFALLLSIAAILGDLVESLLKRDAALKDAGSLLPGMGGILDRIDAPLLAIPIMYYLLLGTLYLSLRVGY